MFRTGGVLKGILRFCLDNEPMNVERNKTTYIFFGFSFFKALHNATDKQILFQQEGRNNEIKNPIMERMGITRKTQEFPQSYTALGYLDVS